MFNITVVAKVYSTDVCSFEVTAECAVSFSSVQYNVVTEGWSALSSENVEKYEDNYTVSRTLSEFNHTYRFSVSQIPVVQTNGLPNFLRLDVVQDFTLYPFNVRVEDITESVKRDSHRIVNKLKASSNLQQPILKAFCNLPRSEYDVYATWLKSADGVHWETCRLPIPRVSVREVDESRVPASNDDTVTHVTRYYYKLQAQSQSDVLIPTSSVSRADVYQVPSDEDVSAMQYMFKMVQLTPITETDPAFDEASGADYKVGLEYSRAVYAVNVDNVTEYAYWDLGNPIAGSKLYHSKKLFSYGGKDFENIVYPSEPGSFITPLSYLADVATSATNEVTAVVPWKSYIVTATGTSISILLPQEVGWTSKLLSPNLGIPAVDTKCCLPGLNGVIFKSNDKVYMMYPNAYAGDDTYVYITDLSKPIEHILSEYSGNGSQFAFATNDEYVLMLPKDNETHCLRYSYDSKSWTYCTYPVVAKSVKIISLTDIVLLVSDSFGHLIEVQFDAIPIGEKYCDILEQNADGEGFKPVYTPILFELDTGMKTDNLSLQKQFVESKFVFTTEDDREMFPVDVTVAVDGDPNITHLDVNSDSPFWKNGEFSRGVVGTSFRLTNDSVLGRSSSGIVRQLVLRYSGKGRSVRHILKGSSYSNFRLYETYVRYKILNIKR